MIYKLIKLTIFFSTISLILIFGIKLQRQFFQKNYLTGNSFNHYYKNSLFTINSQLHETCEQNFVSHYPFLVSILVRHNYLAGGGLEPPTFGL